MRQNIEGTEGHLNKKVYVKKTVYQEHPAFPAFNRMPFCQGKKRPINDTDNQSYQGQADIIHEGNPHPLSHPLGQNGGS
jgi:hypothetical protein